MIEYYLIEFNIKISKLEDEINNLKNEIKEIKKQVYNKCFVDTDEEHNENDIISDTSSIYSECDNNNNKELLSCGCGKKPNQMCQEIEDYLNSIDNTDSD
jgi:archaellum component FlaC